MTKREEPLAQAAMFNYCPNRRRQSTPCSNWLFKSSRWSPFGEARAQMATRQVSWLWFYGASWLSLSRPSFFCSPSKTESRCRAEDRQPFGTFVYRELVPLIRVPVRGALFSLVRKMARKKVSCAARLPSLLPNQPR